MLKQRIITGLILTALAIALIFAVPTLWFLWITAAIMMIAAWEWSQLAGIKFFFLRLIYVALIAACMWGVRYLPIRPVLIVTCIFWLVSLYFILAYPKQSNYWSSIFVRCVMGIFVLVPSWLSVTLIRDASHGPQTLLFFLLLIWAADVGAYFAGKRWGKYKLLPAVSPKKTWQGLWGGLLLSFIVAVISVRLLQIDMASWILLLFMVILLNLYSVTGDLFESMLKRFSNVKDSGHILPGHGGVLDRLDSVTATAPLFLLIWILNINRF